MLVIACMQKEKDEISGKFLALKERKLGELDELLRKQANDVRTFSSCIIRVSNTLSRTLACCSSKHNGWALLGVSLTSGFWLIHFCQHQLLPYFNRQSQ